MTTGVMYAVTYFDGVQLITRSVLSSWDPARYMVVDRYSDGDECLIKRNYPGGVKTLFSLPEAVQLLESVNY